MSPELQHIHLGLAYLALSHLAERLSELSGPGIAEAVALAETKLKVLEPLAGHLPMHPETLAYLETTFDRIGAEQQESSLWNYVEAATTIERAAYRVLAGSYPEIAQLALLPDQKKCLSSER